MTSLQVVLLLSIGITLAAATDFTTVTPGYEPNCTRCEYFDGIGFLPTDYCQTYIMCFKKPYSTGYYRHETMCCPNGTSWNQDHLTCKRDPKCDDPRIYCPDVPTTTIMPCPLKSVINDTTKYRYKLTHEEMMCPWGSYFDEKLCTCIFQGPYAAPCWKILHYNFTDSYDSHSCHNWAVGEAYGFPSLKGNRLCLNGRNQFLAIPFLNNWFAWNPLGKTFTLCFWLSAKADQDAGVLSFNCYFATKGSVIEIWLKGGKINFNLGGKVIESEKSVSYSTWNLICITFNKGHYEVFWDGVWEYRAWVPGPWPINTHSNPTVGYVRGKPLLNGYIDDFCFWTHILPKPEIQALFNKKRSP